MNSTTLHHSEVMADRPRFAGPIWALVLLAPFIAEVLSGSTRTSFLFVFVPEVMVWGVGALLCRELVRRWRAGGTSLLLLGLSLSIAEEFIIQQTSLAPLPFPGSHPDYGRMWGINLVYFLFMLGYESVWVVIIPVQVTELFFPRQATQAWLRKRGALVACAVFLIGSRIAWYGWTQQPRPLACSTISSASGAGGVGPSCNRRNGRSCIPSAPGWRPNRWLDSCFWQRKSSA